eukprot:jgi/Chrzof1/4913/Cz15g04090.t1
MKFWHACMQEFNLEKLQLLEQEKAKIRRDYERKEAQVEVKKKIEYSKTLNEVRLKVLAAREEAIQGVVKEARNKVKDVSKNPQQYKRLLQDLLVQGMKKLGEKTAVVKCRQADLMMVRDVSEAARKQYTAVYGEEAPTLTIDQKDFLPPPPTSNDDVEGQTSAGGVTVTSADGRIECANTLDARVHIAYQANLPDIRAELFGATAHGLH